MPIRSWANRVTPASLHPLHASHGNLAAIAHGAQILSWVVDRRERLYLSPNTTFMKNQAIRGGVPVIFPQFGSFGPGLRHGFARLLTWRREPTDASNSLVFSLKDNAHTQVLWPHAFHLRLTVSMRSRSLELELTAVNPGAHPFRFTTALHTYLSVADIEAAHLHGLLGCDYLDATLPERPTVRETNPDLHFKGELDRIYLGAGDRTLTLHDDLGALQLNQSGFDDTVVWNPGQALGDTMADLGTGEYRRFICIEAARIATPVHLGPGEYWTGHQILRIV